MTWYTSHVTSMPPPPPPPSFGDLSAGGPTPVGGPELEDGRPGLFLLAGLVVTALVCAGIAAIWPSDDAAVRTQSTTDAFGGFTTTVPGASGEPSRGPIGTIDPVLPGLDGDHDGPSLFAGGAPGAVADIVDVAGGPTQFLEIVLYDDYGFVAYRDPATTDHIDERLWREGKVAEARPNPIDDRVDADSEPRLFRLDEVDLSKVPTLVEDARTRYPVPVEITHVIIDRFLPFDDRVLVRVYASPTDGRSGGGYVSYDLAGNLVKVCC